MKTLYFFSSLIILIIISSGNVCSQSGWLIQPTPVTEDLYAVYFVNPYTGFAAGQNGRIIKTTNGGINWIIIGAGVTNQYLQVIQFFDPNTGYITGNWTGSVNNNFWKTTNGGLNWTLVGTLSADRMQFINLNTGWGIINQALGKTTNGGFQWSFFTFDPVCPNCSMNDILFHNANTGYTAGDYWNSGQNMGYMFMFKTTNAGLNWEQKFVYQSNANPYAPQLGHMFFPKNQVQTGYALGSYQIYAGMYKTTNSGENWSFKKQFSIGANFHWYTGIDSGWVTSSQGKIMFTSDGGSNFIIYPTGASGELNKIFFMNDTIGWIAGDDGIILAKNAGLLGIQPVNNQIPHDFSLSQNYPNPFNPSTKIQFAFPPSPQGEGQGVRVIVYNILGHEIAVLVNEQLQPGIYEIDFDGTNYPSGVYYYTLTTQSFSQTKRMVLIK